MSDRTALARAALRGALETRRRVGIGKADPICVFDVAEQLGVEVRFCRENGFEGMFEKVSQTILLPSRRPAGRQAFTCGHELGHWYFGHGSHLDDLRTLELEDSENPDEILANTYSSYLLMPPWAIMDAFARRRLDPNTCAPLQAYAIASQLGVGYETLIKHLAFSLRSVSLAQAKTLLAATPKAIRESLLGKTSARYMALADSHWFRTAIDLEVGDVAVLPNSVRIEGVSVAIAGSCNSGVVIEAKAPGIARADCPKGNWAAFLRVRRKEFDGRSVYRHLEDPDVDQPT